MSVRVDQGIASKVEPTVLKVLIYILPKSSIMLMGRVSSVATRKGLGSPKKAEPEMFEKQELPLDENRLVYMKKVRGHFLGVHCSFS